MTAPASRLITLILLLERRPNQKAADLAEELGISIRTLHRYFGMLDEMGIPIYSERGPNGGFSLVRGYKMPPLVLTPEEAVAVSLGARLVEEAWGTLYLEAARSALVKLENLLPDEQRQEAAWAKRSLVATGLNRSNVQSLSKTIELLRDATRKHLQVQLTYRGSSQHRAETRCVDIYALVHRWGWWYAVGYCHLREGIRTFRVDRIHDLQLLSQPFQAPSDFDIQAYLANEPALSQPQLQVRLCFAAEARQIVDDLSGMWEQVEHLLDGSSIVLFPVQQLEYAASWVLSFGPLCTVMDPPELRQMVREWAYTIGRLYE